MSNDNLKKTKKRFFYLEDPIEFECLRKNIYQCLNSEGKLCEASPCPLNRYRFRLHKQVINSFLKEMNYESAYFYYNGLIESFNIICDVNEPENKNNNEEKISAGCKLFIVDEQIWLKMDLLNDISEDSEEYREEFQEFKEMIIKNMARLQRLAMDDKRKMTLKKMAIKSKALNNSILTGDLKIEGMDINMDKVADISNKEIEDIIEKDKLAENGL